MNCLSSQIDADYAAKLPKQPLAFSSSPNLVKATSRLVLETSDGAILNIELFENNSTKTSPLLFFIPGICESAETVGVQNIVTYAKQQNIRVAVLELEGHGLSSGQRSLCKDFSRLLGHVVECVCFVVTSLLGNGTDNESVIEYCISGTSLGGTLAIYVSEVISRLLNGQSCKDLLPKIPSSSVPQTLLGVVAITPALGVQPEALPPKWIVSALSVSAMLLPSVQPPLTPLEDPSHYNCPEDTHRNFSGHWPLGTSKMLLHLTATKAPANVIGQQLTLKNVSKVQVIAGGKDYIIPLQDIEAFYENVQSANKDLHVLKKAGHDVLVDKKSASVAMELLFSMFQL